MMHTRKRSLDRRSRSPSLLNEPSSIIDPSQLLLLTPQSEASPVPSTSASSSSAFDSPQPPHKKQRTRRNAKTEEEKHARAEERALRNRRAAQESRDRKKKQLEHLEEDNERLRKENELLRSRLELLESRMNDMEHGLGLDVKQEADEIVQAHYPAVVMSLDQQCQTISSPPPRQTRLPSQIPPTSISTLMPSLLSNQACKQASSPLEQKHPSIFQHSTSLCNFIQCQWMTTFSRTSCLNACTDSCATFESLNTGSLEIGAEKKGQFYLDYESGICESSVVLNAISLGFLRMEFLKGLLESGVGNWGMFIDGNIIFIENKLILVIGMVRLIKVTLMTRFPLKCAPLKATQLLISSLFGEC